MGTQENVTVQLNANRMKLAESAMQHHVVEVEAGTTWEQIKNPVFWAHVGKKLRPWDEITVRSEDGAFYGRLLVLDCAALYAKVVELEFHQIGATEAPEALSDQHPDYRVMWKGPTARYCVIRGKDTLLTGKASKAEAQAWLEEHLRQFGATPATKAA